MAFPPSPMLSTAIAIPSLLLLLLLPSSSSQLTTIWSQHISDDSYWYLAAASSSSSSLPPLIYAGTFAISSCRIDAFSFSSGSPSSSSPGICRPAASRAGAFAAIGYTYPSSHILFNSSSSSLSALLDHQYYPAYGSSVRATDSEIFVWGSRPLKDASFAVACAFYARAGQEKLRGGPCLSDFGEGEAAQDVAIAGDGSVLLLSAGMKLAVYRRASPAAEFDSVFNFTFGVVVNFAAISIDGSVFVCSCDDGLCGFRMNATSGSYDRTWSVASIDGFYFENAALGTEDDEHLLLVAVMNNRDSTQWCVGALNASDGTWIWTFKSAVSSGLLVDAAVTVALSEDSQFAAVGSWGDDKNVNPQLHIFHGLGGDGSVLASLNTSGSVTSLLLFNQNSSLHVVVASLDQHENYGVIGGNVTLLSLKL